MARGPEGAFWKSVRGAWSGHAVRVEASHGEVPAGTPDTVLSVGGVGGWVELKVWPDNVTEQQLTWHLDALERGAYCAVLSLLPDGLVWLGGAEEYDAGITGRRVVVWSAEGRHLQECLDMVKCALLGTRRRRRRIK